MVSHFKKFYWTEHSKAKMRQYGLSKDKLSKIISRPDRKEKGIVGGTVAVMKTNKIFSKSKSAIQKKKAPGEIWLMYQDVKDFRKIISAWRYPGVSKPGDQIPIPEDIRQVLLNDKSI